MPAVTPEMLAERQAAIADDTAAEQADVDAQQKLAEAHSHAAETAARRVQTQERRKNADAAILANLSPGEIRGLHPGPVAILVRQGDQLVEGTLQSIHADVPPAQ